MLEVRDVKKSFGGVRAVRGVSVDVARGSITGLIGPNGAGKSTLFNLIAGLHHPDAGIVRFRGERIDEEPAHTRVERGMSRGFQVSRVIERMTVAEMMMVAARPQIQPGPWTWVFHARALGRQERELRERAYLLLERFEIDHIADHRTSEISGGQRKLLDLARSLIASPDLVLLDEPAAGVNPVLANRIAGYVRELRDEGVTFFIIEHNLGFLDKCADRIIVMAEGQNLAEGTLDEVRRHSEVLEAYLGR